MKSLVFGFNNNRSLLLAVSYLFLLIVLLFPRSSFANDIPTSFETTNLSGQFILGHAPNTVTFIGGEAKTVGIGSLYHSGSNSWMVRSITATITFETPAALVDVYFKAQSGAIGAMLNVYDVDDTLVGSFVATTSWEQVMMLSNEGIARMELINTSSSYAVLDDFNFTALAPPPPSGDPVALADPIGLPIFSGGLKLKLELVANGLVAPLWGIPAPGVSDYFYVIDQVGAISSINMINGEKMMVADLSSMLVDVGIEAIGGFDERGLLGIAFDPDFETSHLLYTYSSQPKAGNADFSTMPEGIEPDHQGVLTQWQATISGPGGIEIDPLSGKELLRVDEPQFNHNGGAIAFDASGMLYLALGDGGGADDVDDQDFIGTPMIGHGMEGNGQDITNILGTIIRINPLGNNSSNGAYGVPIDNPFIGETGVDEIFAYGLRNPYRISFDSSNGDLYAADVGQNDIEEVNLIIGGGNYGWNLREGSFGFFANDTADGYVYQQTDPGNTINPIAQYDHDEGIAIIGGFVYRGSEFEDMVGHYVFGDYNGRLFYINNEGTISEFQDVDDIDVGAVLGFATDSSGELYVLANTDGIPSGTSGSIYKMTLLPNQAPVADAGSEKTVNEGALVTLNAGASSDPDGDPLGYEWMQMSGPSVTIINRGSAMASFTAPSVTATTMLSFKVLVNDGHLSNEAMTTVTVNDVPVVVMPRPRKKSSGALYLLLPLMTMVFGVRMFRSA